MSAFSDTDTRQFRSLRGLSGQAVSSDFPESARTSRAFRPASHGMGSFAEEALFHLRANSIVENLNRISDLIDEFERFGLKSAETSRKVQETLRALLSRDREYRYETVVPVLTRYVCSIDPASGDAPGFGHVLCRKRLFVSVLVSILKEIDRIDPEPESAPREFDNVELQREMESVFSLLHEGSDLPAGTPKHAYEFRVLSNDGATISFPKAFENVFGDLFAYSAGVAGFGGSVRARIFETAGAVVFMAESTEKPSENVQSSLSERFRQGFESALSRAVFYATAFEGSAHVTALENGGTRVIVEIPKAVSFS
jgi:hypothetical protein